jgi:uncharacterized delta-60 repeat protein
MRIFKNVRQRNIFSTAFIGIIYILFLNFLFQTDAYYNYTQVNKCNPNRNLQISSSNPLEQQWHTTWGGVGDDSGDNIVVDSLGNLYLAGYTESFGAGGSDMVLVKYNNLGQQQWNTTWGGVNIEYGLGIALDSSENIYVGGRTESFGAGSSDGILVKYNGLGQQQWNTTWGDSGFDGFNSIIVDSSDNIFIAGATDSSGAGGSDIVLVKYNSTGQQQWNTTWGGTSLEFGWDIAVDSSENIYISGITMSFGAGLLDIVLVKYNSLGQQQWNTTWGGSGTEFGWAIALDSANNIFLAGYTNSFGAGSSDMVLVKYNSLGEQQWNATWGGVDYDYGHDVAVDSANNIFLAGYTSSFGVGSSDGILVQYNGLGQQQWNTTWGGSGDETGYDIVVDSSDNVFLAGSITSFGAGGEDILLIKYVESSDDNGAGPIPSSNPPEQQWNTTWGRVGDDWGRNIAVDSSNNIYITGRTNSFGAGGDDIVLVKYDNLGQQQWNTTWGTSVSESGYAIALDSSGNIFITGSISTGNPPPDTVNMILVKFNSLGEYQWNKTWGGGHIEWGWEIILDSSDNILITGFTFSYGEGSGDLFLVKYGSQGTLQWDATWGGSEFEIGFEIALDSSDNIFITGVTNSYGAGSGDLLLVKYNSQGMLQWNTTWGVTDSEYGEAIVLDSSGNIFLAGGSTKFDAGGRDMVLVKFNSLGQQQWNTTWGGSDDEYGRDISVDSSNNLYIVGITSSFGAGGDDIVLVKYDNLGRQQWNITWGGSNDEFGSAIALDSSENIYIAGYTMSFGAGLSDMVLIKYNQSTTRNGAEWIPGYNLFLLLGGIGLISAISIKKRHRSTIP